MTDKTINVFEGWTLTVQGREFPFPNTRSIKFREAQFLKNHGITIYPPYILDQMLAGDHEAFLAAVVIAKLRADGDVDMDAILDLVLEEDVRVEPPASEAEAVPFEAEPPSEPSSENENSPTDN